jgi:hypothetical protein
MQRVSLVRASISKQSGHVRFTLYTTSLGITTVISEPVILSESGTPIAISL